MRHRANKLREFLEAQTRIVDLAIHLIAPDDLENRLISAPEEVSKTIVLMLQAQGVSLHSLRKLTATLDMSIRDCFGIARSIVETAVNIAYIVAEGPNIARHAQRHAMQKSFRDIHRRGSIGGFEFLIRAAGSIPSPEDYPALKEALEEFTGRKGRERDWTACNIDARIDVIRRKYGGIALALSGAVLAIYRHSSEILHGSYFGSIFFWTSNGRATSRATVDDLLFTHFVQVFSSSFFATYAVLEIIAEDFKIPLLKETNKKLFLEFNEFCRKELLA